MATATTKPTAIFEDDDEVAPLDFGAAPAFAAGCEGAGVADAAAVLAAEEAAWLADAAARTTLRSWGIMRGVFPERSMEPSSLRTSGLAARKFWVYKMFSATY